MRVFVSVDMEGVAGVATRDQCRRGSDSFAHAARLMTAEANAAVAGAFDGGATAVTVNDSHADMANLLADEVDPRAELVVGSPKVPQSMLQGLDSGYGVALFVGYHAGAGDDAGVLAHTYSGLSFYDVRLNGESMTETELNARLAATYGVPLGLVTGDQAIADLVGKKLPGVRTVAVKRASGFTVAASMHPERACAAIREAAAEVVRGAGDLAPPEVSGPFELEVDLTMLRMADVCSLVPGVTRSGRTVRFATDDYPTAFRCLLAWTYLAGSVAT